MSAHLAQPGDVIAGKYRIVQLLGQGGMGAVYAATHTLTGKRVALKWLLPELATNAEIVQRFLREAQAAARVEHPNVVDVYDVGNEHGAHFLVMEFLDGESLGAAVAREALTPSQVIQVVIPAVEGVGAAHRVGVVHRDIKPDNIFLCRDINGFVRNVKVLDFGISKLSDAASLLGNLTQTGATMGTPHYMAPEQLRGSKDIDGRADIYSFGVILYEALTGRKPFDADTFGGLAMAVVSQTPLPLRELDAQIAPPLERAVLKAIARDRADRFATATELVDAIRPFAATTPIAPGAGDSRDHHSAASVFGSAERSVVQSAPKVTATPAATSFHANQRGLRKPWLWAGVAAGLLGATFLAAWLSRPAHPVLVPPTASAGPAPVTASSGAAGISAAPTAIQAPTAGAPAQQLPAPTAPAPTAPAPTLPASPEQRVIVGAAPAAPTPPPDAHDTGDGKPQAEAPRPRASRSKTRGARETNAAAGAGITQKPAIPQPAATNAAAATSSQPPSRKLSPAVERVGDVTPDEF